MSNSRKDKAPFELSIISDRPGVYKFKNGKDKIIYVGAASNLKKRISSYFFKTQKDEKTSRLVRDIKSLDYEILDSIEEVFLRERDLISEWMPKYNIKYRDDRSYPLVKITLNEKWPRIMIVREKKNDKSFYYGRKVHAGALRSAVKHLRQAFPICMCKSPVKNRKRPCLNASLGLCLAPCCGLVDKKEYMKNVEELMRIFSGEGEELVNAWEEEMMRLSDNLEFERAAKIRNKIDAVQKTIVLTKNTIERDLDVIAINQEENTVGLLIYFIKDDKICFKQNTIMENITVSEKEGVLRNYLKNNYLDFPFIPEKVIIPFEIMDIDLISTWLSKKRREEVEISVEDPLKSKWLSLGSKEIKLLIGRYIRKKNKNKDEMIRGLNELKALMELKVTPRILEAFDISSFRGSHPVGSLVVFKDGFPQKSSYRRFRIKGQYDDNDDVSMMGEVTYRRYKRLMDEKGEIPDTVIIDGGKPQLNRVVKVFKSLNIDLPVAGLAKKREELYLPGKSKPILLKGPVKHLLQNLRDEAHRFAITYHKNKRMSSKLVSDLDKIPGIGNTRRKALLQEFGSINRVADATVEDLQKVVPKKVAEHIFMIMRNKRKKI